jgi:GR25 family glycosyltransferase involved in LPS biosynthesis
MSIIKTFDNIKTSNIRSVSDITNVVYINLDSRTDRRVHIEKQLNTIGFANYKRFKAIQTINGAIGCSMSHLKCLELARDRGLTHLLVCEDDTTFLSPSLLKSQLNKFLSKHSWDVILLGGNNAAPYVNVDDTCIKVANCQTTTCYLVNERYFQTLINNIKSGLSQLVNEPTNRFLYSIDKYWLQLQKKDNWYLIIPLTVTQKEGYSDIEKTYVNYNNVLTDISKGALTVYKTKKNTRFSM